MADADPVADAPDKKKKKKKKETKTRFELQMEKQRELRTFEAILGVKEDPLIQQKDADPQKVEDARKADALKADAEKKRTEQAREKGAEQEREVLKSKRGTAEEEARRQRRAEISAAEVKKLAPEALEGRAQKEARVRYDVQARQAEVERQLLQPGLSERATAALRKELLPKKKTEAAPPPKRAEGSCAHPDFNKAAYDREAGRRKAMRGVVKMRRHEGHEEPVDDTMVEDGPRKLLPARYSPNPDLAEYDQGRQHNQPAYLVIEDSRAKYEGEEPLVPLTDAVGPLGERADGTGSTGQKQRTNVHAAVAQIERQAQNFKSAFTDGAVDSEGHELVEIPVLGTYIGESHTEIKKRINGVDGIYMHVADGDRITQNGGHWTADGHVKNSVTGSNILVAMSAGSEHFRTGRAEIVDDSGSTAVVLTVNESSFQSGAIDRRGKTLVQMTVTGLYRKGERVVQKRIERTENRLTTKLDARTPAKDKKTDRIDGGAGQTMVDRNGQSGLEGLGLKLNEDSATGFVHEDSEGTSVIIAVLSGKFRRGAATVEGNQVLLGDKKPVVPDWLKSCQLQDRVKYLEKVLSENRVDYTELDPQTGRPMALTEAQKKSKMHAEIVRLRGADGVLLGGEIGKLEKRMHERAGHKDALKKTVKDRKKALWNEFGGKKMTENDWSRIEALRIALPLETDGLNKGQPKEHESEEDWHRWNPKVDGTKIVDTEFEDKFWKKNEMAEKYQKFVRDNAVKYTGAARVGAATSGKYAELETAFGKVGKDGKVGKGGLISTMIETNKGTNGNDRMYKGPAQRLRPQVVGEWGKEAEVVGAEWSEVDPSDIKAGSNRKHHPLMTEGGPLTEMVDPKGKAKLSVEMGERWETAKDVNAKKQVKMEEYWQPKKEKQKTESKELGRTRQEEEKEQKRQEKEAKKGLEEERKRQEEMARSAADAGRQQRVAADKVEAERFKKQTQSLVKLTGDRATRPEWESEKSALPSSQSDSGSASASSSAPWAAVMEEAGRSEAEERRMKNPTTAETVGGDIATRRTATEKSLDDLTKEWAAGHEKSKKEQLERQELWESRGVGSEIWTKKKNGVLERAAERQRALEKQLEENRMKAAEKADAAVAKAKADSDATAMKQQVSMTQLSMKQEALLEAEKARHDKLIDDIVDKMKALEDDGDLEDDYKKQKYMSDVHKKDVAHSKHYTRYEHHDNGQPIDKRESHRKARLDILSSGDIGFAGAAKVMPDLDGQLPKKHEQAMAKAQSELKKKARTQMAEEKKVLEAARKRLDDAVEDNEEEDDYRDMLDQHNVRERIKIGRFGKVRKHKGLDVRVKGEDRKMATGGKDALDEHRKGLKAKGVETAGITIARTGMTHAMAVKMTEQIMSKLIKGKETEVDVLDAPDVPHDGAKASEKEFLAFLASMTDYTKASLHLEQVRTDNGAAFADWFNSHVEAAKVESKNWEAVLANYEDGLKVSLKRMQLEKETELQRVDSDVGWLALGKQKLEQPEAAAEMFPATAAAEHLRISTDPGADSGEVEVQLLVGEIGLQVFRDGVLTKSYDYHSIKSWLPRHRLGVQSSPSTAAVSEDEQLLSSFEIMPKGGRAVLFLCGPGKGKVICDAMQKNKKALVPKLKMVVAKSGLGVVECQLALVAFAGDTQVQDSLKALKELKKERAVSRAEVFKRFESKGSAMQADRENVLKEVEAWHKELDKRHAAMTQNAGTRTLNVVPSWQQEKELETLRRAQWRREKIMAELAATDLTEAMDEDHVAEVKEDADWRADYVKEMAGEVKKIAEAHGSDGIGSVLQQFIHHKAGKHKPNEEEDDLADKSREQGRINYIKLGENRRTRDWKAAKGRRKQVFDSDSEWKDQFSEGEGWGRTNARDVAHLEQERRRLYKKACSTESPDDSRQDIREVERRKNLDSRVQVIQDTKTETWRTEKRKEDSECEKEGFKHFTNVGAGYWRDRTSNARIEADDILDTRLMPDVPYFSELQKQVWMDLDTAARGPLGREMQPGEGDAATWLRERTTMGCLAQLISKELELYKMEHLFLVFEPDRPEKKVMVKGSGLLRFEEERQSLVDSLPDEEKEAWVNLHTMALDDLAKQEKELGENRDRVAWLLGENQIDGDQVIMLPRLVRLWKSAAKRELAKSVALTEAEGKGAEAEHLADEVEIEEIQFAVMQFEEMWESKKASQELRARIQETVAVTGPNGEAMHVPRFEMQDERVARAGREIAKEKAKYFSFLARLTSTTLQTEVTKFRLKQIRQEKGSLVIRLETLSDNVRASWTNARKQLVQNATEGTQLDRLFLLSQMAAKMVEREIAGFEAERVANFLRQQQTDDAVIARVAQANTRIAEEMGQEAATLKSWDQAKKSAEDAALKAAVADARKRHAAKANELRGVATRVAGTDSERKMKLAESEKKVAYHEIIAGSDEKLKAVVEAERAAMAARMAKEWLDSEGELKFADKGVGVEQRWRPKLAHRSVHSESLWVQAAKKSERAQWLHEKLEAEDKKSGDTTEGTLKNRRRQKMEKEIENLRAAAESLEKKAKEIGDGIKDGTKEKEKWVATQKLALHKMERDKKSNQSTFLAQVATQALERELAKQLDTQRERDEAELKKRKLEEQRRKNVAARMEQMKDEEKRRKGLSARGEDATAEIKRYQAAMKREETFNKPFRLDKDAAEDLAKKEAYEAEKMLTLPKAVDFETVQDYAEAVKKHIDGRAKDVTQPADEILTEKARKKQWLQEQVTEVTGKQKLLAANKLWEDHNKHLHGVRTKEIAKLFLKKANTGLLSAEETAQLEKLKEQDKKINLHDVRMEEIARLGGIDELSPEETAQLNWLKEQDALIKKELAGGKAEMSEFKARKVEEGMLQKKIALAQQQARYTSGSGGDQEVEEAVNKWSPGGHLYKKKEAKRGEARKERSRLRKLEEERLAQLKKETSKTGVDGGAATKSALVAGRAVSDVPTVPKKKWQTYRSDKTVGDVASEESGAHVAVMIPGSAFAGALSAEEHKQAKSGPYEKKDSEKANHSAKSVEWEKKMQRQREKKTAVAILAAEDEDEEEAAAAAEDSQGRPRPFDETMEQISGRLKAKQTVGAPREFQRSLVENADQKRTPLGETAGDPLGGKWKGPGGVGERPSQPLAPRPKDAFKFQGRNLVESIEETLAAERMARRHAAELAEAERQGRIQDRAAQQVSQTSPNHVVWRAAEFDRQKGGRCEFVLNEDLPDEMKRDDPEGPHGKWLPAAQLVQVEVSVETAVGGETAKRTVKRWWTRDKAGPVRVAAAAAAAAAGAAAVVGGGADSAEAALRAMRLAQQRAGHLASMASRDRVLKAELERVAPLASQYEGQTSVLATKIAAAAAGVGGQWDDGADPEGMQTMQATGGRFVRPEGMTTGALDYWTGGAAGQGASTGIFASPTTINLQHPRFIPVIDQN